MCKIYRLQLNLYIVLDFNFKDVHFIHFYCRNLVSASQDGKLIVWDSYTTNKVLRVLLYQECHMAHYAIIT